jgi:cobalt transporter subunit CbtB
MNNASDNSIAIPAVTGSAAISAKLPAIVLLAFGLITIYCVGFSTASAAHNATHDTRHASGFPCH